MSASGEPPKLYANKPKKSKKASATVAMASPSGGDSAPPPPKLPQAPQKESFIRRYRFLWPLLLVVNFGIGGYVLLRTTSKKDTVPSETEKLKADATSSPPTSTPPPAAPITETPIAPAVVVAPPVRAPIPEDQQRELFRWILEEKRKVKARDPDEKRRIDEEKTILKQFIRAKSVPSL